MTVVMVVVLLALPIAADGASPGGWVAFGYNFDGELRSAINTGTLNPNPTPTLVAFPGQIGNVSQIAAGAGHSLAVTSSGQLYAFGINLFGQPGMSTNSGTSNPNPTPTLAALPGENETVTQVAAGSADSFAVSSSGQLYAFGLNIFGELGISTNSGTSSPNPTPTLVRLPGQMGVVTEIAAGGQFSLALTSSGQLYAFGSNSSGELGSATNNGTSNPNPTPTLVGLSGEIGAVTQIAAASGHSLAVTSSGQLYAFGVNSYGELGSTVHNETVNPNPTPTLVMLAAGMTIDTVAKGPDAGHTLAIVSDLAISGSLPAARVGSGYSAGLSAAGGTAPLTWSASGLPGGLSIAARSGVISGTPTVAESFSVTVTVTDSYGSQSSQTFTLTIAPAALTHVAPARPTLTNVSESHRTWHETGRKPIGTTFSFTLNQPATISRAFTRSMRGRRVKGRCPAQNNRNRHHPACTRKVSAGNFTITAHVGVNKLFFKGIISHSNQLPRGRYTLVIVARAAGRSSTPRTLSFTILGTSRRRSRPR